MSVKTSYIITGPTASGKSGFAHLLAQEIGGTIINCDSVQIYSGIENISASPFAGVPVTDTIDDIPYKLFSILPLSAQISVADYIELARREYDAAIASGRTPIFVGGTGYYINGLINGIAPIPEISDENRKRAREMVTHDLSAARKLVPDCTATDPQRVARALEVLFETGKPLSVWQTLPRRGAIEPTPFKILINPPLDILHERIAARIPEMLSGGAIAEAQYILDNKLNPTRAIGAVQLCDFLRGDVDSGTAINNWVVKTNQYAKRQRTWFRTQFDADVTINHIPKSEDVADLI